MNVLVKNKKYYLLSIASVVFLPAVAAAEQTTTPLAIYGDYSNKSNVVSYTTTPVSEKYIASTEYVAPLTIKSVDYLKAVEKSYQSWIANLIQQKLLEQRVYKNLEYNSLRFGNINIEKLEKYAKNGYINDEHLSHGIVIIDDVAYKSKSFGDRLVVVNGEQSSYHSHGTMVASVLNRYAKQGIKFYSYNADGYSGSINPRSEYFTHAHKHGLRIFSHSWGSRPTGYGSYNMNSNIIKYAKEDSVFVWAAGNEYKNFGTPESMYPTIDDDARNGWISVADVKFSGSNPGRERMIYSEKSASNYIGEEAKTWGIATQGFYAIWIKDKEKDEVNHRIQVAGTSGATPRVSAIASNVWQKFPWMDNHLVVVSVLSTADDAETYRPCNNDSTKMCGDVTTKPNEKFGWGLLNKERALNGPARFDKLLLTNKDAVSTTDNEMYYKDGKESQYKNQRDLLVVNFDYRNYIDKSKLTWDNDIAGDAGILKKGTGSLYLSGKNTYAGKTIIEDGVLGIGDSLNSQVYILQKGTLLAKNNSDRINKKVILGTTNQNNYSLVNKGSLNVYGNGLTINGDYEGKENSRIVIDIDKSNLEVKGKMSLADNSKLVADVETFTSDMSREVKTRKVVEANEISANRDKIISLKSDNIPYLDVSNFDIQNKSISVSYKRNSSIKVLQKINYTPAAAMNTAKNFEDIAGIIDSSDLYNNTAFSAKIKSIFKMSPYVLPAAFDSLSAEIYSSSQDILFKQNRLLNKKVSNRIMDSFGDTSDKNNFYVDGIFGETSINKKGFASAKANIKGAMFGADTKKIDNTLIGAVITQNKSEAKFSKNAGDIDIDSMGIFAYGMYDFDYLYLSSVLGFDSSRVKVNRDILDDNSKVKYNSKDYSLYTELGKNFKIDKFYINPYIGYSFNKLVRGSFAEKEALGISADSKSYNSSSLVAGFRANAKIDNLNLSANIAHIHDVNPNDFGFNAFFVDGQGGAVSLAKIKGAKQPRNISWLGFGISYSLLDGLMLQTSYDLSIQDKKKDSSIFTVGATYKF
ncbi:putative autotransporter serine protease [Campylobacter pinnipediorum subsp. pinnipediorum]|uniref:autotransporter domain-containing protein n=1 Tax=Campylobacter pinnipediorum TaxID=1965231 RepID=UPI000995CE9A|nr:autotransporter domain-containing protein [Campylobacter pinnipediorum]AQW85120.1 putative autotransporter serine protease [Campylobacter pinnipediorum subsp. pinnipediorum]